VHGIGGSAQLLRVLERGLKAAGYRTCNLGYASLQLTIEQSAEVLAPQVRAFAAEIDGSLNFVAHSMGGLVLRVLLKRERIDKLGRVVMLAPPNGGSELADLLHRTWPYRRIFGPAGSQLVTKRDEALLRLLGDVDFELGIIAGSRSLAPLSSMFLPRPNDGRVSIEATRDRHAADHLVIPVSHTMMPRNALAIRQTIAFLRTGRFDHDEMQTQLAVAQRLGS
jgi:pimeloyl-ACP methyl ester carboxylesterase